MYLAFDKQKCRVFQEDTILDCLSEIPRSGILRVQNVSSGRRDASVYQISNTLANNRFFWLQESTQAGAELSFLKDLKISDFDIFS